MKVMLKIHEMKNKTLLPFYIYHLLVQNPDLFYLFSIEHIIYAFSIQIVEIHAEFVIRLWTYDNKTKRAPDCPVL